MEWPRGLQGSLPRPPVESFGYAGGDFIGRAVNAVLSMGRNQPGRFVAFWWQPCGDDLEWMDDRGHQAVGQGNNWAWIRWRHSVVCDLDFGSSEAPGVHALVWDRATAKVYIAVREHVEQWLLALNQARQVKDAMKRQSPRFGGA